MSSQTKALRILNCNAAQQATAAHWIRSTQRNSCGTNLKGSSPLNLKAMLKAQACPPGRVKPSPRIFTVTRRSAAMLSPSGRPDQDSDQDVSSAAVQDLDLTMFSQGIPFFRRGLGSPLIKKEGDLNRLIDSKVPVGKRFKFPLLSTDSSV